MSRSLAILGSTGSIGTQALQVVGAHPGAFDVIALAAGGSNQALLAEQVLDHRPAAVALASGDPGEFRDLLTERAARRGTAPPRVQIHTGPQGATELAGLGTDVVLNGITGSVGLEPTLAALQAGSTLALANKESLVAGGGLVRAAQRHPEQIVPVDSEHSAIAQALRGGRREEVATLVLTASGGPFRGRTRAELTGVTPAQALAHPNFDMGLVVTTNSATMVNKGLEVIEAHMLFDVPLDDIAVVVHPEQQIHSMVAFRDGSTLAQIGPPRMLVPIALGLSWPDRLDRIDDPTDWSVTQSWQFHPLDDEAFPAVALARAAAREGGTHPAVYNAANEECVAAFHGGRLPFTGIVDTVAQVVAEHSDAGEMTLARVARAESWARFRARELIG